MVLDLIVSGFAAWGIFCAMKFIADGFLTPKNARPRPIVKLTGKESSAEIAQLCENARKAIVCNRGEILLLAPEEGEFSRRVADDLLRLDLRDVKIVYEKERQE